MLTPMLLGNVEALIHHGEILQQCANWIDADKLKIEVSQTFPLAEAAKAHAVIESGSLQGKLVLLN
jgi:NADPH2:quinone reductase